MTFYIDPVEEIPEPTGLEPLEWDDSEEDEDTQCYDLQEEDEFDEDEFEDSGLAGFDDLRPFGSFDDGFGWDDRL